MMMLWNMAISSDRVSRLSSFDVSILGTGRMGNGNPVDVEGEWLVVSVVSKVVVAMLRRWWV